MALLDNFRTFDEALLCDTLEPIQFEYLYQQGVPHNISDYNIALHHSGYLEWNEKYHHTHVPVVAHYIYLFDGIISENSDTMIYDTLFQVPIDYEPVLINTKENGIRMVYGDINIPFICENLFLDSASAVKVGGTIHARQTGILTTMQCFGTCSWCSKNI